MSTGVTGINKQIEINRKKNLRDHRLYWIGRRAQDVIIAGTGGAVAGHVGYSHCNCGG